MKPIPTYCPSESDWSYLAGLFDGEGCIKVKCIGEGSSNSMTNIVVLCHERYRLTVQCVESIRKNTKEGTYTLTLVDDDSQDFRVRNFLDNQALYHPKDTTIVRVIGSRHCLGALKNLGVTHSTHTFGRSEYICVLDNDVCVFQDWLPTLEQKLVASNFAIIGGVRHPFHQSNAYLGSRVDMTDAVAGYCHFFRRDDARKFAPEGYVTDAPGIGQSEDFEICQRAIKRGAQVGYVNPPVMAHCGITNSKGEPIAGAELIERVPGVLYL